MYRYFHYILALINYKSNWGMGVWWREIMRNIKKAAKIEVGHKLDCASKERS